MRLLVTLNARLRPLDRGHVYEDPLMEVLEAKLPGSEISGGGTLLTPTKWPSVRPKASACTSTEPICPTRSTKLLTSTNSSARSLTGSAPKARCSPMGRT
ncbi:hypothetical protein [Kibdelosporangium philippinense]|uniref:hypothetical protein n=1 Tax=Kibdelosporangium philippinense TaxID=211113 RepID=UPI00360A09AD